jgi:hypothetical protein
MTNEKSTEKKKTLTFDNKLVGKVTIDRETLVRSIENEHRSYGAHSCRIDGQSKFNLPELESVIPKGFKLDVVVKLEDRLGQNDSAKKGVMSL